MSKHLWSSHALLVAITGALVLFCFGLARASEPSFLDGAAGVVSENGMPALRLLYVANTNGVLHPCPT